MMIMLLFLLFFTSSSLVFSHDLLWNAKGLNPLLTSVYRNRFQNIQTQTSHIFKSSDKLEFLCLDGSRSVPISVINDDFCDCVDGSDEPGTSACSNRDLIGEKSTRFWCKNEGFQSLELPRWKVNDGICDCCDGSDEEGSDGLSSCPDTCQTAGIAWRKAVEDRKKEKRSGLKVLSSLMQLGKQLRQQWESDLHKLQKEVEENLEPKIAQLEAQKKLFESQVSLTNNQKIENKTEGVTSIEEETKPITIQSSSEVIEQQDNPAAVVSEYAQWMDGEKEKKFEKTKNLEDEFESQLSSEYGNDDDELSNEDIANESADGVIDLEEKEEDDDQLQDSTAVEKETSVQLEGDHEEKYDTPSPKVSKSSIFSKLKKFIPQLLEKHFGSEAKIGRITRNLDELRQKLQQSQQEISDLQTKLKLAGGKHDQFLSLYKKCYKTVMDKYEYKICLLEKASQNEGASAETSLGQFSELIETENDKIVMRFEGGASCWNGPNRSVTVTIICGSKHEIIEIRETERCVYTGVMKSPTACTMTEEGEKKEKKDEL